MNRLMRYLNKLVRIPFAEKMLFFEAILFLFIAKIMLLIFPFKSCLHFLSLKHNKQIVWNEQQLQSVKTAVNRANKLAFWKNVCLVQSITARWMLNRRKIPSRLSIGVAHDENKKLIAHAWIKVGNFEIVNKGLNYKELYFI